MNTDLEGWQRYKQVIKPRNPTDRTQWNEDTSRLLEIVFKIHSPDQHDVVVERMREEGFDMKFISGVLFRVIDRMMTEGKWYFFDEDGSPSPLVSYIYRNGMDQLFTDFRDAEEEELE